MRWHDIPLLSAPYLVEKPNVVDVFGRTSVCIPLDFGIVTTRLSSSPRCLSEIFVPVLFRYTAQTSIHGWNSQIHSTMARAGKTPPPPLPFLLCHTAANCFLFCRFHGLKEKGGRESLSPYKTGLLVSSFFPKSSIKGGKGSFISVHRM